MKYTFKPKSNLERFGFVVYKALVENFPKTYFVGGTTRDYLLGKKIKDIDIATEATPLQIAETLKRCSIEADLQYQNLGVVIANQGRQEAAIATLRRDLPSKSRYPKIEFVKSAKSDAQRRDFTINALYFSPKSGKILDFFQGLKDLKSKTIRFIGNPEKRIKQDPLRVIRALRFALDLNFQLDPLTKTAIKKHFSLVKQLTVGKTQKEILKLNNRSHRTLIKKILDNQKYLDKCF